MVRYDSIVQLLGHCIQYHHVVCNAPVSCKAYGDGTQFGAWLDSDLIVE